MKIEILIECEECEEWLDIVSEQVTVDGNYVIRVKKHQCDYEQIAQADEK